MIVSSTKCKENLIVNKVGQKPEVEKRPQERGFTVNRRNV
jgi:hypothetical protein